MCVSQHGAWANTNYIFEMQNKLIINNNDVDCARAHVDIDTFSIYCEAQLVTTVNKTSCIIEKLNCLGMHVALCCIVHTSQLVFLLPTNLGSGRLNI